MNQTIEFLDALWRDNEGYRVVASKAADGKWQNFPCKDNADALQRIERIRDGKADCYFAAHLFKDERRTVENAVGCRALYLDIDAKDHSGILSGAKAEADKFILDAGLPMPVFVCSGRGYHLWWLLNETLSESAWMQAARQLKALCRQYGLKADESVTADAARVMRVPGTINYKDAANPKECKLITDVQIYDFEVISKALETAAGNKPDFKESLAINDLLTGGIESGFADNPQESQEIARLCLPYLSRERCEDYDGWLDVGLALSNVFAGGDEGLTLWDDWSKAGGKYQAGECANRWQGFGERFDENKLRVGSLIHWAREDSADFRAIWEKRIEANRIEKLAAKSHEIQNTDLGNAQRLVALQGEDIRYDYERKVWFVWNGKFWQENAAAKVRQLAKATVKAMYADLTQIQDDTRRQSLVKHAVKSESANSLNAMVKLAESEPEIQADISAFDTQPHLLNAANGVIDLRCGKLLPHTREMMLSNCVSIDYRRSATCPIFEAFLNRIFDGKPDLIGYLQRAVGYTLTGENSEQCFFLCYGEGANGKSTLLETIHYLLNDTAAAIRTEALMKHQFTSHSGHNEDIANLRGKRFVSAVETESGQHFAESQIKQLTGGDTITASRKYGHNFSFQPQFKMWIAANHKPQISGTDEGIWRRIRLIPFAVRIPENERDNRLKERLQSELPGILAWAVRGAIAWYVDGLGKAFDIENANAEYRNEQDTVANFLSECCETGNGLTAFPFVLYERYKQWCSDNGEDYLDKRKFPASLDRLGYKKVAAKLNGQSRVVWQGIKIKIDADFIGGQVPFMSNVVLN